MRSEIGDKGSLEEKRIRGRLSVVTVCRNASALLKKTLESVNNQLLRDRIEYIVIDGASTDGSVEYCNEKVKERKIDKFVTEPDRGIYDAMNKGADMAEGEWILFMNAGDVFSDKDVVKRLLERGDLTDAVAVYGDVRKKSSSGEWELKRGERLHNSHRMIFCHQSVMTRREVQQNLRFDISHPYSADFKFFKQLMKRGGKFEYLPIAVADFDTEGVSNRNRSAGLADNIRVVMECDNFADSVKFLLHLVPVYVISRLRGK